MCMEHYIKTTEEFEDYSIERTFSTDQLSVGLWLVRISRELIEARRPSGYGIGVGGSILTSPMIAGGIVYFGCCDKNMYAVSLEGKERWRFQTGGPICDARLHKDTLYFGSFDGNFYALDLHGSLKWKFACKDKIWARPLVHKGRICFGSKDKNFYALSPQGTLLWKYSTGMELMTRPVACEDSVFFSSSDGGKIFCLDLDGNLKWEFATGETCSVCALHNDTLLFSSLNRTLYAVTLDGKLKWKTTLPSPPTLEEVKIHNNRIYLGDYGGHFICLDLNGNILWTFTAKDIVYERPVFYQGMIYFPSFDGIVHCLEEKTGAVVWEFTSGGPIVNTPVLAGKRIIYGGYDCNLYCISTEGKLLWKFPTSLSYMAPITPTPPRDEQPSFQVVIPAEEPITTEEKYKGKTEEQVFGESVYSGIDLGYAGGSVYKDKKKQRYL
jgi:outer membrane protein assembly factor BamB